MNPRIWRHKYFKPLKAFKIKKINTVLVYKLCVMAMSIVNSVFDGVLAINLDKDTSKQLDALNIRYTTTPSHRKCWQHMLKQGWSSALIVENGAVFGDNFDHRFLKAWLHVPSDWEQVYIGYQDEKIIDHILSKLKPFKPANKHVLPTEQPRKSCAYAITAPCAKKLFKLQNNVKSYEFTDTSLVQRPSLSLSKPLFRVHNVNVEGWSIVFFITGFIAGYATRRWLACTAVFLLCMGLDYKRQKSQHVHAFILRTLCFALGALLGSRVANKSV